MKATQDIEQQMKQAILGADISRYALAKLSGVSEGVISNFINGHRTITMETAAKLARILEVELKPTAKAGKAKANHGKHRQ